MCTRFQKQCTTLVTLSATGISACGWEKRGTTCHFHSTSWQEKSTIAHIPASEIILINCFNRKQWNHECLVLSENMSLIWASHSFLAPIKEMRWSQGTGNIHKRKPNSPTLHFALNLSIGYLIDAENNLVYNLGIWGVTLNLLLKLSKPPCFSPMKHNHKRYWFYNVTMNTK